MRIVAWEWSPLRHQDQRDRLHDQQHFRSYRHAFDGLTNRESGYYCLVSCFVADQPTAAIAAVTIRPVLPENLIRRSS